MDQSYLQSFLDGRSMWTAWLGILIFVCLVISIVLLKNTHKPKFLGGRSTTNQRVPSVQLSSVTVQNFSPHFPTTIRGCPNCHQYMVVTNGMERCTNINCRFGLKKK